MKKRMTALVLIGVFLAATIACTTTLPVAATSNPVGPKMGEASSTLVLNVFPIDNGDMSIHQAAKNGGITKISTVDFQKQFVFLYFLIKYTTIVSGE